MYYPVLDYPYTWCTQYPVLDLCDPHIWYIHYPVLDTASGIPSILYWIYVIPISGIFSIFGNLLPSAGLIGVRFVDKDDVTSFSNGSYFSFFSPGSLL